MKKTILFAMIIVSQISMAAGTGDVGTARATTNINEPVLKSYRTRQTALFEGFSFENGVCFKTGQKQSLWSSSEIHAVEPKRLSTNSTLCKMIRAANIIQRKIGSCWEVPSRYLKSGTDYDEMIVMSGSDANYWSNWDVPTGSCMCARQTVEVTHIGIGMLDPLSLFFIGPYSKKIRHLYPVSAETCASLFPGEFEKNVVREAYKAVGLK